jgi:hypothetical protein
MTHDISNLFVTFYVPQDSFTDFWVSFHLTPFGRRERSCLLQKARGEPDLADVMHEPSKVGELLLFGRET